MDAKGPQSRADLDQLIQSGVGESGVLEYKAAGAVDDRNPKWKEEMTKDVSAFANAAGGTLIYGIQEFSAADKKHLPEKIMPIDAQRRSREWFDQILGQIQPRIDGLEIRPIHVGPAASDFCFAVIVPKSETAHQATDLRYYKRRNFETTAMEDYEIRDVMNRAKHPRLSVMVRIIEGRSLAMFNIKNEGVVMAKNYLLAVEIPYDFGGRLVGFEPADGYIADEYGESFWRVSVRSGLAAPLFPQSVVARSVTYLNLRPIRPDKPLGRNIPEIRITAYADSMPPQRFIKPLEAALKEWV